MITTVLPWHGACITLDVVCYEDNWTGHPQPTHAGEDAPLNRSRVASATEKANRPLPTLRLLDGWADLRLDTFSYHTPGTKPPTSKESP